MKTFLCVIAAALTFATSAAAVDDGAYGVVALDFYAVKCMRPNDPQRWAFRKKLNVLSNAFKWAELNAASKEVQAVLDRLGVQEYCRSTEAAMETSP